MKEPTQLHIDTGENTQSVPWLRRPNWACKWALLPRYHRAIVSDCRAERGAVKSDHVRMHPFAIDWMAAD